MKKNKLVCAVALAILGLFLVATPTLAISNPNSITMPYYKVFYDVKETGDMFLAAEGKVIYTVEPTDYTASEAFLFEWLDVAGTTTLASTPISDYGDRPTGIYLNATQVTALGLVVGTSYKIRIVGNPLIFASTAGNIVNATLVAEDYSDQNLGADGGIPSNNNLRNGMLVVAQDMENYDTPADDYITTVQGYDYLTIAGGDLFLNGMPGLNILCPILFQTGIEAMTGDDPESTGTYGQTLTVTQKWGATVANGLTMLGSWLGINQALAGSLVLFALVIALAVYVYSKTESGIVVLLMVAATPFIGAYLGLMPLALAFIFVIFIVVLLGYFFFSRGAL